MSILPGIYASQITGHLVTGSFDSIATVSPTSSATVTFSSIPSTYKHLQIRILASVAQTVNPPFNWLVTFNGDSAANYSRHRLQGDGSSASSYGIGSQNYFELSYINGSLTTMNAAVVDILDYQNTNKYKTTKSLSGYDANGSGFIVLNSGSWQSTSAITSISITQNSGGTGLYAPNTSFALYGIRG